MDDRSEHVTSIVNQIKNARRIDRSLNEGWHDHREFHEYVISLDGFIDVLKNARIINQPKILDIGTGVGIALCQIAEEWENLGLKYTGTCLVNHPEHKNAMNKGITIILTSAEKLRGVPSGRFGGIIAVRSISYCSNPNVVAHSIDRVLAPGGTLKASFRPNDDTVSFDKPVDDFYKAFQKLGYSCSLFSSRNSIEGQNVLKVIKPNR